MAAWRLKNCILPPEALSFPCGGYQLRAVKTPRVVLTAALETLAASESAPGVGVTPVPVPRTCSFFLFFVPEHAQEGGKGGAAGLETLESGLAWKPGSCLSTLALSFPATVGINDTRCFATTSSFPVSPDEEGEKHLAEARKSRQEMRSRARGGQRVPVSHKKESLGGPTAHEVSEPRRDSSA
ncbi:hypothetical protein LZ31DRAFT_104921 [Colletotrichum somersetense]|nr:hypothetical protein LZ31DRAFT_104921 [Colletotrichum somersetense]